MTMPAFRSLGNSAYQAIVFSKKLRVWKSYGRWVYSWDGVIPNAINYPTKRVAIHWALREENHP